MTPIDRSYANSYQSAIVSIALSFTIFETYDIEKVVTLKSRLRVTHPVN